MLSDYGGSLDDDVIGRQSRSSFREKGACFSKISSYQRSVDVLEKNWKPQPILDPLLTQDAG